MSKFALVEVSRAVEDVGFCVVESRSVALVELHLAVGAVVLVVSNVSLVEVCQAVGGAGRGVVESMSVALVQWLGTLPAMS